MSFFKPEDFEAIKIREMANHANTLLKERGVKVFGKPGAAWFKDHNPEHKTHYETHQALLVCIEELKPKSEACEHEPMNWSERICYKCEQKLKKPKWEVDND